MSFSIPRASLEKDIKPFLRDIIEHPKLKVGPDGTHVGLIRFDKQTKLLFDVGSKSNAEMEQVISGLDFDMDTGGQTRTDLALKKANQEVRRNITDTFWA